MELKHFFKTFCSNSAICITLAFALAEDCNNNNKTKTHGNEKVHSITISFHVTEIIQFICLPNNLNKMSDAINCPTKPKLIPYQAVVLKIII